MIHYKHWIALERAHGIGPAALKEIYDTLNGLSLSIEDLFGCTEEEIRSEFAFNDTAVRGITEAKNLLETIENDYLNIIDAGIRPILFFEDSYPALLTQRLKNQAPAVLYTLGNRALLSSRGAAVLGHSGTSEKGELIAYGAAKQCAQRGITVIGGVSKGAGSQAHAGALENGGATIGVIPCGFLTFDMSPHLKSIYNPDTFLLISPYYPAEEYSPFNAMNRNRIICALSHAVFIVEAPAEGEIFEAAKSASKLSIPLYTAEYAQYPESAAGNSTLIHEMHAFPVRGRKDGTAVIPNIDHLVSAVKFSA